MPSDDRPTPKQQRYLRSLAQKTGTSFTPPRAVVTPDAGAWRSFRRSVERLEGWPWQGRFEQPPEGFATDGIDWAIKLSYADGSSAECEGYNAFPPGGEGIDPPRSFRNFCRAVSRLLGGRYFGW